MNTNRTVLIMTEIAILTALAVVLDYVGSIYSTSLFPNGGSISLGMLPVFIIAFRRGLGPALISGFLLGVLQNILEPVYVAAGNIFMAISSYSLDYPLAFTLVGLSGLTYKLVQNKKISIQLIGITSGILIGGTARFISHVISGIFCWKAGFIGSIAYNFPYMAASILLSLVVAIIINFIQRRIYTPIK